MIPGWKDLCMVVPGLKTWISSDMRLLNFEEYGRATGVVSTSLLPHNSTLAVVKVKKSMSKSLNSLPFCVSVFTDVEVNLIFLAREQPKTVQHNSQELTSMIKVNPNSKPVSLLVDLQLAPREKFKPLIQTLTIRVQNPTKPCSKLHDSIYIKLSTIRKTTGLSE